jgi:hypothetical protein
MPTRKKRAKVEKTLTSRHLRPSHLKLAVRLRAIGKTQSEIAAIIGTSQSCISSMLADWVVDTADMTPLATQHVRSRAYDVARHTMNLVLTSDRPESGIRVLEDLSVLPRADAQTGLRVDISVGSPSAPAGDDPFDDRDLGQVIDMSTIPVLDE